MNNSHEELKLALCAILNLDPEASDKALISVVNGLADAVKQGETEAARRTAAEAHEREVQKILKQAGGALRRDQAEQVLSDRAASSAAHARE
jgi:hypothetical protein